MARAGDEANRIGLWLSDAQKPGWPDSGPSTIGWTPEDEPSALADLIPAACIENPHDFAHAEVPAEGRVYLYCRNCGEVRKLEASS